MGLHHGRFFSWELGVNLRPSQLSGSTARWSHISKDCLLIRDFFFFLRILKDKQVTSLLLKTTDRLRWHIRRHGRARAMPHTLVETRGKDNASPNTGNSALCQYPWSVTVIGSVWVLPPSLRDRPCTFHALALSWQQRREVKLSSSRSHCDWCVACVVSREERTVSGFSGCFWGRWPAPPWFPSSCRCRESLHLGSDDDGWQFHIVGRGPEGLGLYILTVPLWCRKQTRLGSRSSLVPLPTDQDQHRCVHKTGHI